MLGVVFGPMSRDELAILCVALDWYYPEGTTVKRFIQIKTGVVI